MPRGRTKEELAAISKGTQFKSGKNAVENGKKGGIQNGINAAKRRSMRSELEEIQMLYLKDKQGKDTSTTRQTGMLMNISMKAANGDIRAAEFIRDMLGEKPVENIMIAHIDPEIANEVERMVYDTQ